LEDNAIEVSEIVSASRKLGEGEARALILEAKSVYIAKGKKLDVFEGGIATEEIVKNMLGATGNLRAPTITVGDRLVVGFNEETYREVLVE